MLPVFINLLRRLYFMRASRESAAYHSLQMCIRDRCAEDGPLKRIIRNKGDRGIIRIIFKMCIRDSVNAAP